MRNIHSNMTGGEIDPRLHSRADIDKFAGSVAVAENVTISPFGGLRRRAGLKALVDGHLGSNKARLMSFVASETNKYIVILNLNKILIMKDGSKIATVQAPLLSTAEIIRDLDAVQYLDTLIIVHKDIKPFSLVRDATNDSNWSITVPNWKIPKYDFNDVVRPAPKYTNTGYPILATIKAGDIVYNLDGNDTAGADETYYKAKVDRTTEFRLDEDDFTNTANWGVVPWGEPVWSDTRGYPSVATFHGQRLWLASTNSLQQSVFGSKVNGYFDFRTGTGQDDYGIFDTLETGDYNRIVNITTGRSLQVFTESREFVNTQINITPANSAWAEQTAYGSKRIRPVNIDGSTYFIDKAGSSIRALIFNRNEDSYISPSISLLSSNIIRDVVDIGSVKGTSSDVSDFVYVVNGSGTVAVLNTNRLENISGWTHWTTEGKFADVVVLSKEVYFLVERDGEYYIEMLDDSLYSDHASIATGALTGGVNTVQTNYKGAMLNKEYQVTADFNVQQARKVTGTEGNNSITINRQAERIEVGLGFTSTVTTLPEPANTNGGSMINRKKRIGRVNVDIINTAGIKIKEVDQRERKFVVKLDSNIELATGVFEVRLMGYSKRQQVTVTQKEILPMFLRSLDIEVIF